MDFETGLRAQVAAMPQSFNKRRLQHILTLPEGNWRKTHALLRMEQEARDDLGVDGATEVDWSEGTKAGTGTINWANIIQLLIKILPLILALFGA